MDKCIFSTKHVFCILGARWHKILECVTSFPIYGWLAWWCDFFPCGANLWRSSACIQPKKVQPIGIYFWHLRLGLFRSPFWLVKLHICGCKLFQGQMYVQPKIMCFALWARVDTQLLNLSHHVLSMDGWPGDATFFLWGQPLKIIRMYSAKKGPAPWNLFLTPAPRPLQVTFLVGEAEHMWL